MTVVVFANFFHRIVRVDDEGEGRAAGGLRCPRPHHDLAAAGAEVDGGSCQFAAVHLKGDGEGFGFDVAEVEERCRQLNGVSDLWNPYIHSEGFGNHLGVGTQVVDAVPEDSDGVRLGFRTVMLRILHLHRPGPHRSRVNQDNLEIVENVAGAARCGLPVGEIVAQVEGPVRRGHLKVEIVNELGGGKTRASLVRPC